MSTSSVLGTESIRDVAELLGIVNLNEEVARAMALDVEYRIHEILQEALKFMRHSQRTFLSTSDIDSALKALNIEPVYGFGYHALQTPLEFVEVPDASGQAPIYYIENEEIDLEKIINTPLPKVCRDISYTAHWLSIEGVQPAIPQNPSTQNTRLNGHESSDKTSQNSSSAVQFLNQNTKQAGPDTVIPPVKQVISKELQLYFEKLVNAILDESNNDMRRAAMQSLRCDPGLHQLLPYFVHFISKKVADDIRNLFILHTMLQMLHAILENPHLFIEPYVHQIMAPILTCMVAKTIGSDINSTEHCDIRHEAASLMGLVCQRFDQSYQTLRSRVTRTLLKAFLDDKKPLATHYGAIIGFKQLGTHVVRYLLLPNVKIYSAYLKSQMQNKKDALVQEQAERNFKAIIETLSSLKNDVAVIPSQINEQQDQQSLIKLVGEEVANEIIETKDVDWIHSIVWTAS